MARTRIGPGRDRLVESAGALFAQSGFEGVSTKQLAAHAGLSIGALYHHFPSKLDAYRAALKWGISRIAPPDLDQGYDARQTLEVLVRWFCTVITAQTIESRLLCLELLDPHLDDALTDHAPFSASFCRFREIMMKVYPEVDFQQTVATVVSLSFGFARLKGLERQVPDFAGRIGDPASIAETVMRIVL